MNIQRPLDEMEERSMRPAAPIGAIDVYRDLSSPGEEDAQEGLRSNILKYVGLAFKHKWLMAMISGVFLFGGLISTLLTTPIYSAATTIRIERAVPKVMKDQGADSELAFNNDPHFYQTQYEPTSPGMRKR